MADAAGVPGLTKAAIIGGGVIGAGWAARLCAAGIDIAVEAVPLQAAVTAPMPRLVEHLLYFAGGKLTLKQARHGSLIVGGGWPSRYRPEADGLENGGLEVDSLEVDPERMAENVAVAAHVVPAMAGAELVRAWPAIVNGTSDWRPILGPAPEAPRVYTLVFPWMGFTAGPGAARLTADHILGRETGGELAAFSVAQHQIAHRIGQGIGQQIDRQIG